MTYKTNSIVNVPIIATDTVTLFTKNIDPIMNVLVKALSTEITGLPNITIASGSNGQVLGLTNLSVVSTSGFSSTGNLSVQDAANSISTASYTGKTGTAFTGQSGEGGTLVAGYGVTTLNNNGSINSSSNGHTLPTSIININCNSTPPSSGTMYIWTTSSSGGQTITYTSTSNTSGNLYQFAGCSGGTTTLTTGDLVFFTPYTTVTSPSAGTELGSYIIYVNTTTGIPSFSPASEGIIYINGTSIYYTGTTGGGTPSFTGCFTDSGPTGQSVYTGESVTLSLPLNTLEVVSTVGFPNSGNLVILGNQISYTGISGNSFTGVSGSSGLNLNNGYLVSESINSYGLGFPKGVPFTAAIRNTLSTTLSPFLYSTSGNNASLIAAGTTIASGSNGQTLPQSTIYVASTTNFPSSGSINILDTAGNDYVTYTSITGGPTPSFNGCSGGTGTLSTGDTVTPTTYNTVITGINNSLNNQSITIGNSGSNNNISISGGDTNLVYISSSSAGVEVTGTLPDTNNGNLIWAITDYTYSVNNLVGGASIDDLDTQNSVTFFVSDGYSIRITQNPQSFWQTSFTYVSDNFNIEEISGNLSSIILITTSLSAPFSVGIYSGSSFSTTIENSTSYAATIGYSTNDTSITSNSIVIPPGETFFVYGDGTNIFSPNYSGVSLVYLTYLNSLYQMIEPSGTTYLVDATTATVGILLPISPFDGQTFTIKDPNSAGNGWANNNVEITSASDSIESPYSFSGSTFTPGTIVPGGDTLSLATNGNSITYIYSLNDATWFVKNQLLPD